MTILSDALTTQCSRLHCRLVAWSGSLRHYGVAGGGSFDTHSLREKILAPD